MDILTLKYPGQVVEKQETKKFFGESSPISELVKLQSTPIGENYVRIKKYGPYVRYSNTQKDHYDIGLISWMEKSTPEEIEASRVTMDQGTLLHRYFEAVLKGENPKLEKEEKWAEPVIANFLAFKEKVGLESEHIEKTIASEILGIGGTVDFIGKANMKGFDETGWLFDWKTGGIHESYKNQLAVYKFICVENNLIDDQYNAGICQFHRDGKKTGFKPVESVGLYLRGALHTYERWKLDNLDKLSWLLAPEEVLEERKKLKGAKRKDFEKTEYKPEYAWPWVHRNSVEDATKYLSHL